MITRARSLLCFAFLALLIPTPAQAGRVKAFDAPMSGAQIFDYDTESKQVTSLIPKLIGVDPSNVVGEWYAGWSSAGDLLDLTGRGRDLADAGTAPTAVNSSLVGPDGNQLQAFSYDGISGRHELAHASWMNTFDQDFSLVQIIKTPSSVPGAAVYSFSHGGGSVDGGVFGLYTTGAFFGILYNSSLTPNYKSFYGYASMADGLYHVIHWIRSGDAVTIYQDGIATTPTTGVNNGYGLDGSRTLYVGTFGSAYYNQPIAYTRLQNSALTYSQIQKELSLWQGLAPGIGGNRLGSPTFIRSTTSYAERSTGSVPLVQVPANVPVQTSDGGVLVEGAVTQLFGYTGAFSTGWTKARASIAATAVTLPDGTSGTTNVLHEDGTAVNDHYLQHSYSSTSGTSYTASFYAKYNSAAGTPREWVRLNINDGTDGKYAYFNVRYGYVGTVAGAATGGYGIKPTGNNWYRVWVWLTSAHTATGYVTLHIAEADADNTFNGADQDSVFIAMPQLQTGAFPTTYHPNPTTGAARSADSLTYIPWRISKDLASKVNATPRLLFLGSESLTGATVAPTTGAYVFSKNGRPQNDNTYAEGPSFKFNGTTDWLSLPDASGGSDFDFSAAGKKFSVTASFTPLSISGAGTIIGKWDDNGVEKRQWLLYQTTTGIQFVISKDGQTGVGHTTAVTVNSAVEIGKPLLVTATYDGTMGDGNAVMWLYVDAATAAAPLYQASSTTAFAPIYNSDAPVQIGAWGITHFLNGKLHYAAVYDGTVTTLAEHQAMYTSWKIDGILPLTISSTSAKTKLVIEYDAKAQFSSATDVGGSKHQFTIAGTTGAASGTKNAVVVYAALNGPVVYYMYDSTGGTVRSMSSGVSDVAWNKWNTFKFTIDLTELANSTMTVNSVSEKDSTSNFTGAREVYLGDSLIRIGALTTPVAHSEFRNVRVSAE